MKTQTKRQVAKRFADAGILAPAGKMSAEQLQARISQRPVTMPNSRAQSSRNACRDRRSW